MKILVVGLGLIGGSVCKSLAGKGHTIYGNDTDPTVVDRALQDGVIVDTGTLDAGPYDCIFLCLHHRIATEMLETELQNIAPNTILTDTFGLKGRMVRDLTYKSRKYGIRYVSTHPMAGREKSGYEASIPDLFQGATLILTPIDITDQEALETVENLGKEMGFGHMVRTNPMWHDNMIAYTSQLAHIVSSAYVKDFCMEDALSFAGGSFQDMTRVATMNAPMWTSLFLDNRDNLLYHLDLLLENLTEYRDALKQRDEEKLLDLIEEGRQIQEENVRKRQAMQENAQEDEEAPKPTL